MSTVVTGEHRDRAVEVLVDFSRRWDALSIEAEQDLTGLIAQSIADAEDRVRRAAHAPLSFAAALSEFAPDAGHVTVRVFAGPDADHRASCGSLVMRREQAHALVDLLGPARP